MKLKKLIFLLPLVLSTFIFSSPIGAHAETTTLAPNEIIYEETVPPLTNDQLFSIYGKGLENGDYEQTVIPIELTDSNSSSNRAISGSVAFWHQNGSVHWKCSANIVGFTGRVTFHDRTSGQQWAVGVQGTYGSTSIKSLKGHTYKASLSGDATLNNGQVGFLFGPDIAWKG